MKSACVLIECPYTGMVLGVSRKDDPTAWGLPGGKTELTDSDQVETARRELREETGLNVPFDRFVKLFEYEDCVTYRVKVDDILYQEGREEAGRVQWVTWIQLFEGPFGDYNERLFDALYSFEKNL